MHDLILPLYFAMVTMLLWFDNSTQPTWIDVISSCSLRQLVLLNHPGTMLSFIYICVVLLQDLQSAHFMWFQWLDAVGSVADFTETWMCWWYHYARMVLSCEVSISECTTTCMLHVYLCSLVYRSVHDLESQSRPPGRRTSSKEGRKVLADLWPPVATTTMDDRTTRYDSTAECCYIVEQQAKNIVLVWFTL